MYTAHLGNAGEIVQRFVLVLLWPDMVNVMLLSCRIPNTMPHFDSAPGCYRRSGHHLDRICPCRVPHQRCTTFVLAAQLFLRGHRGQRCTTDPGQPITHHHLPLALLSPHVHIPLTTLPSANQTNMSVANGVAEQEQNGVADKVDGYQSGSKLEGGQSMSRTITPGGHVANDDLLAIGAGHRRLANPLPLGAWSFATTTLVLSLYNVKVQGITVPNAVLTFSLFYGGFTQWLAGLWEFASGNTLGGK